MSIGRFTGGENPLVGQQNNQQQQQQQQPAPGNPGNPPPAASQSMYSPLDNSNQNPSRESNTGGLEGSQNPMDKWAKMLDNPPNPDNSGGDKGTGDDLKKSDPKKAESDRMKLPEYGELRKAFDMHNPLQGVDQELLKQATSGDIEAFSKVISQAVRDSGAQSSYIAMQGLDRYMQSNSEHDKGNAEKQTQATVRRTQISDAVIQKNPNLNSDTTRGVVADVTKKFMERFPNESASSIAESVDAYMKDWAASISGGGSKSAGDRKNSEGTDWMAHIDR